MIWSAIPNTQYLGTRGKVEGKRKKQKLEEKKKRKEMELEIWNILNQGGLFPHIVYWGCMYFCGCPVFGYLFFLRTIKNWSPQFHPKWLLPWLALQVAFALDAKARDGIRGACLASGDGLSHLPPTGGERECKRQSPSCGGWCQVAIRALESW
jgi:hypothetical protein